MSTSTDILQLACWNYRPSTIDEVFPEVLFSAIIIEIDFDVRQVTNTASDLGEITNSAIRPDLRGPSLAKPGCAPQRNKTAFLF